MCVRKKLINLKPCPFCGGEAIEAWNRRAGKENDYETD